MLYLGKETPPTWAYPALTPQGYANREAFEFWSRRDPIVTYAARLEQDAVILPGDVERMKREVEALVEAEAQALVAAPWPDAAAVTKGVLAGDPVTRTHVELLDRREAAPDD